MTSSTKPKTSLWPIRVRGRSPEADLPLVTWTDSTNWRILILVMYRVKNRLTSGIVVLVDRAQKTKRKIRLTADHLVLLGLHYQLNLF